MRGTHHDFNPYYGTEGKIYSEGIIINWCKKHKEWCEKHDIKYLSQTSENAIDITKTTT